MIIKKTIHRNYYRIKVDDLVGMSDLDIIRIIVGDDEVIVKVGDIRDRYERGIGNSGNPSKDWMENGEHKSTTGIPVWLKKLSQSKIRNF